MHKSYKRHSSQEKTLQEIWNPSKILDIRVVLPLEANVHVC